MINERVCEDTFSIKMLGTWRLLISENSWSSDSMVLLVMFSLLSVVQPLDLATHAAEGS